MDEMQQVIIQSKNRVGKLGLKQWRSWLENWKNRTIVADKKISLIIFPLINEVMKMEYDDVHLNCSNSQPTA